MRILIAEDDQVLADGLLRSLRGAGYAVDQVSSGSEADAALASHEFDLLILDLGLPRLHGLEVLRKLRARGSALPTASTSASRPSTWAPTTSWPSRSRCRSSRRACAPSSGAAWARPRA
jgi:DNA-binding response OmpR family regulator